MRHDVSATTTEMISAMCLRAHVLLLSGLAFLTVGPDAAAQSLEFLLMPGEVISAHADIEAQCDKCHIVMAKEKQPGLCLQCHEDVGRDLDQRSGYHGAVQARDCRSCHTEHKGRGARIVNLNDAAFDHRLTDFELSGAHRKTPCAGCHKPGKARRNTPHECGSCHADDDVHAGFLGKLCADCHVTEQWPGAQFDHDTTAFALTGEHAGVACTGCHAKHDYEDTPTTCIACHREDDKHEAQFGETCENCHVSAGWKTLQFDHDTETDFALRGRHTEVSTCEACHQTPLYQSEGTRACVACHLEDDTHQRVFGRECESCHTEADWLRSTFDHDSDTRFMLEPAHRAAWCAECHVSAVVPDAPLRECVNCHADDDPHAGALGKQCGQCHQQRTWADLRFDHAEHTRFPLRNAHAEASCGACHKDMTFRKRTPRTCVACHKRDDMKHGHRGRFGSRCQTCHGTATWRVRRFNHRKVSRFSLLGKHTRVQCKSCHTGWLYKQKLSRTCVNCHRDDDPHEGKLGERCQKCHTAKSWQQSTFDHDNSAFKLRGAHKRAKCQSCHKTTRYKETPSACVGCHASDDKHREGLGPRCDQCHQPTSWSKARFDHRKETGWPLTGKHRSLTCHRCHSKPARGKLETSTRCYSCHRRDDVHLGSLTLRCDSCHQSNNWKNVSAKARAWAEQGGPPGGQ